MPGEDKSALDKLKERLPDVESSIEDAAERIERYTAARESNTSAAINNVAKNVEDGADELDELIQRGINGQITTPVELLRNLIDVASPSRTELVAGAGGGAYAGGFAGPIGAVFGAAAGTSIVYYTSVKDGRRIIAIPLEQSQVPSGVSPTPSTEPPIADSRPLQKMLDRCLRRGDAVEEQQDLTRFLDVDSLVNRLYDLERVTTADDELYDGYYIDHKGQPIVVFIDEP